MNCSIIGAGQLGSRHLQGLLKYSKEELNIYVLEPNIDSINLASGRAYEIDHKHKINFCTSLEELPNNFEFVVIATNANVRFMLIHKLVNYARIKYLILEKVLFQNLEHYKLAINLLSSNNVKAFVNHPRRMIKSYQLLKEKLTKTNNFNIQVYGTSWGLGTSSLHFIDLFEYLTDSKLNKLSCEFLNSNPIKSKRNGYLEFEGTLHGVLGESSLFSISSISSSFTSLPTISIMTEFDRIVIQEYHTPKIMILNKANDFEIQTFDFIPEYQSELTGIVFEKLIETGSCELTSLEDASQTHMIFIKALLSHLNSYSDNVYLELPIT